ncbi:threonine-phosphate decarboxylase [Paramesorhizobium deserti]|uniref:threonine-phosphate decarboxylase n=1 Tax=Paramesorhizobium deserti TaxID=1494590 RepID=A0A135HUS6_9HYPH|nr:threonine-phosphate decarboxylase CobD [Paramesorhizobium deserti]KXF76929.1 threonine-phosphate decarboxylase [Paramesorhizobium deserti]
MTIEHGGALDRAIARFGAKRSDWLDLSTGINPEAFPLPVIAPEVWNRLPDEALLNQALQAARRYYGVAEGASIVAAPGTQALIQIVPELAEPGEVAILSPTYQEHHAAFARAGWAVMPCADIGSIPATAQAVVVVNPNNPDGRIVAGDELLGLAQRLQARGGFLIIDEAFADASPEVSIAAGAGGDNLIVFKSFGKFFGLAGLRLGFAISGGEIARKLAERLGPWAVSGPALAIATQALRASPELEEFRGRVFARRARLSAIFKRVGVEEIGGTALFALVRQRQAHTLHEELCRRHILVRKFDYARDWLRIGLAADEPDFERLEQAFKDISG